MPVLTVIAGPNGSGKSTLIETLLRTGIRLGEYFNADDIARAMTSGLPEQIAADAQQIVRDRRAAAMIEGRDHAFETVMSHPSHIEHMHEAARAGFEVRLYFVATEDPAINLDRVANRVAHGGHDVPADRVRSRYYRTLALLGEAIDASNISEIFDNSRSGHALRHLAAIEQVIINPLRGADGSPLAVSHVLTHASGTPVKPQTLPVWWLTILLQLKPDNPFEDGLLG